jgi:hypothetical protein
MRCFLLEVEEIKQKITGILESNIEFEGHFSLVIENTDDNFHKTLLDWVQGCKEGEERIYTSKKNKRIVAFIFKSSDTRYRAILTKEKNKYFIVLFLDKHKYYERERDVLGI